MNIDEFTEAVEEVLGELAPNFRISTDRKGQIVIHTGMYEDDDGDLYQEEESADPDLDEDMDLVSLNEEDEDDEG